MEFPFFNFFKKKDKIPDVQIPPEMYRSVHVMQDDIDMLHGKTPELPKTALDEKSLPAGSPFFTADAPYEDKEIKPSESERGEPSPSPEIRIQKTEKKSSLIFVGVGVGVLILLGIGAYFFFFFNKSEDVIVTNTDSGASVASEQKMQEIPQSYYSKENPNYLPIDVESDQGTPEGIRAVFAEAAAKVGEMNLSTPVEFVIVDKNNFPIAFSRFAYLLKLDIPEDMIQLFGESFSVYILSDRGTIRYGLSLSATDEAALKDRITAIEGKLPSIFSPIIYDHTVAVPAESAFRSGKYGELPTRFSIVDTVTGVSFDYAFFKGEFVIGTSKEMFQGILSRIIFGTEK